MQCTQVLPYLLWHTYPRLHQSPPQGQSRHVWRAYCRPPPTNMHASVKQSRIVAQMRTTSQQPPPPLKVRFLGTLPREPVTTHDQTSLPTSAARHTRLSTCRHVTASKGGPATTTRHVHRPGRKSTCANRGDIIASKHTRTHMMLHARSHRASCSNWPCTPPIPGAADSPLAPMCVVTTQRSRVHQKPPNATSSCLANSTSAGCCWGSSEAHERAVSCCAVVPVAHGGRPQLQVLICVC